MRHIELVLTDEDLQVLQHITGAQRDTMNEMVVDGRIVGDQVKEARLLINTFNSLWWKLHWALNPKEVKK
jgi:hypothetical protein